MQFLFTDYETTEKFNKYFSVKPRKEIEAYTLNWFPRSLQYYINISLQTAEYIMRVLYEQPPHADVSGVVKLVARSS